MMTLLTAVVPLLFIAVMWLGLLLWMNGRQKTAISHQDRMANATERQAAEMARIADALEALGADKTP
jgi:Flp pilus assembly protein TadB